MRHKRMILAFMLFFLLAACGQTGTDQEPDSLAGQEEMTAVLEGEVLSLNGRFLVRIGRYEKTSAVFTSNKTFSQWNVVFADVTIASAILDRVLHHCTVINITGENYRKPADKVSEVEPVSLMLSR